MRAGMNWGSASRILQSRLIYPCLTTALFALWQFLTVTYNYSGNWTALFKTSHGRGHLPEISEQLRTFAPGSDFDGQFYHYMAHDVLPSEKVNSYIDAPRHRYRRILVPALARLIALGQDRFVDLAYFSVLLLAVFAGTYWLCAFAGDLRLPVAWGAAFALVPSVIVSMNFATIDGALAALCVGAARYSQTNAFAKLCLVLSLAALVRETGLLLIAGYLGAALLRREYARARILAATALPAAAWWLFVAQQTSSTRVFDGQVVPFLSILQVFRAHEYLSAITHAIHAGALLALWMTFPFAIGSLMRGEWQPGPIVCALFSGLGLVALSTAEWHRVSDFARVFSPLLLLLGIEALASRRWWLLVPMGVNAGAAILLLEEQFRGIVNSLCQH
jgi:hypothetical protein